MVTEKNKRMWSRLIIPLYNKEESANDKIKQAIKLLNEAGVEFDYGTDGRCLDVELDWSLSGAYVEESKMRCMQCRKTNIDLEEFKVFLNNKQYENYMFCCIRCYNKYVSKLDTNKVTKD